MFTQGSRRAALSVAAQAVPAAAALASFLVLVRIMPRAQFGLWVFVLAVFAFLEAVRNGFCQPGLIRYGARASVRRLDEVTGGAWILAATLTGVLVTAALVIGTLVPDGGGAAIALRWYPVVACASMPLALASWRFHALERFDRLLVARSLQGGTFFLLLIALRPDAASGVVVLYALAAGFASLVVLLVGWAKPGAILRARRLPTIALLRFGRYSVGTQIGTDLLSSSDIFLLGGLLGPEAVALYAVPQRIVQGFRILVLGIGASVFPGFSQLARTGRLEELRHFLFRSAGSLTLVLVPVVVGGIAAADLLLSVAGGADYAEARYILWLFLTGLLLMPVSQFFGMALDALGQADLNFKKVAAMLAINVVGDVTVLLLGGSVTGVAAVTLLTMLSGAVMGFRLTARTLSASAADLWKGGVDGGQAVLGSLRARYAA